MEKAVTATRTEEWGGVDLRRCTMGKGELRGSRKFSVLKPGSFLWQGKKEGE